MVPESQKRFRGLAFNPVCAPHAGNEFPNEAGARFRGFFDEAPVESCEADFLFGGDAVPSDAGEHGAYNGCGGVVHGRGNEDGFGAGAFNGETGSREGRFQTESHAMLINSVGLKSSQRL